MTQQITIWILLAILFTGELLLFFLFLRFFKRLNQRFGNIKSKDILNLLSDTMKKAETVEQTVVKFFKMAEQDRALLQTTLHKVGFVRFNPFRGMGGSHSFCIALLDANYNGILITSLYNKEGVRIYAKEVVEGKSEQAISAEEERALQEAMKT